MKDCYKIGEISKIYGIGRDSLRYYEEIGLLNPFRDNNGYRMYSMQDIWKLNIIKDLRSLNFSMKKIKEYLDNRTVTSTKKMLNQEIFLLDKKINELTKFKKNILQRINNIENTIKDRELNKIKVVFIEERKAFKLNGNISRDEEIDFLMKRLQKKAEEKFYFLGNNNIGAKLDLKKIKEGIFNQYESVFSLIDNSEEDYDVILKEGYYVTLSYKGSYEKSKIFIPKMLKFIEKNNCKLLDNPIEIYKIDIHETSLKEEFITEIQIPVKVKEDKF